MALSPHVLRVAGVVRVRGAEGWRGNDLSLLQLGHDLLSSTVQVVEGGLCSCVGILGDTLSGYALFRFEMGPVQFKYCKQWILPCGNS